MTRCMVAIGFGLALVAMNAHAETPALAGSDHLVEGSPAARLSHSGQTPMITWHESIDSGWAEARRRDLPMVIFITSDRCTYCDAMKQHTWRDASISQRLSKEFVAIRLTPKKNSKELGRVKVDVYPTTLIGLPEGKIADKRFGYQPVEAIHGLLSQASQRLSSDQ